MRRVRDGAGAGGRGRRVERDGFRVDNGQHLLLGAYARTLELVERVGGDAGALRKTTSRDRAVRSRAARRAHAAGAPRAGRLGLLIGLLSAGGLSWRERFANIAWFRDIERARFLRPARTRPSPSCWHRCRRASRGCCGNRCASRRSTRRRPRAVGAGVRQRAARGVRGHGDADATSCCRRPIFRRSFPKRPRNYVAARGGSVAHAAHAQIVAADRDRCTLASRADAKRRAAAIVAVGPHQLAQAFAPEALARIRRSAAAHRRVGSARLRADRHDLAGLCRRRRDAGPDRATRRRAGAMGHRPARRPAPRRRRHGRRSHNCCRSSSARADRTWR